MKFLPALALLACPSAAAFSVTCRRAALQQALGAGVAVASVGAAAPALALEACPRGSQNCIRTVWTPPAGATKAEVAETLRVVLQAYPAGGLPDGTDNNGFTVAEDALATTGAARVEYRNFGNFAKFLNGGRPYVDDLVLEIGSDGKEMQIRSASRIGESDLGVNQRRLQYLGQALRAKGWTVPEPAY